MADCTALFSNARWGITTTNLKVSLLVIATEILFSIAAPIPFSIRSAPAEQCNVSSAVDVDVVVVVVVVVDVVGVGVGVGIGVGVVGVLW